MHSTDYFNLISRTIAAVETTQAEAFHQAACLIKDALIADGVIHIFSTGHSHMMIEEMFYRAGGLVPVDPVFDSGTMLHHGATKSSQFERLPGYARAIFSGIDFKAGDPFIIVSTSGINPVPVEMAMLSKQNKLPVIAITSKDLSQKLPSRLPGGEKLMDLADIVLDLCIDGSDTAFELGATGQRICAQSTVIGAYIIQRLLLEIAMVYEADGIVPPVFASANVPGGDEWNKPLIEKYRTRIRYL